MMTVDTKAQMFVKRTQELGQCTITEISILYWIEVYVKPPEGPSTDEDSIWIQKQL